MPVLIRDRRGSASIEFAIVIGVLVSLLLGVADLVPALLAKYKSANATSSAADLATQAQQMQTTDVADIFAAAADVLAPFSTGTLVMRMTSVASDGKGNAFVHWSCGQGALPAYTAKSTVTTTPTGDSVDSMIYRNAYIYNAKSYPTANTTYIVVESRYAYTAPVQYILSSILNLANVAFALPRQSSYVGFPWDGIANDVTTAPTAATKIGSVTLSNGAVCNYIY